MTRNPTPGMNRKKAEEEEKQKRHSPFLPDAAFEPSAVGSSTYWGDLDPRNVGAKAKELNGEVTVSKLDLSEEEMAAARERQDWLRKKMREGRGHMRARNSIRSGGRYR